jgi:hypothetical protein
MKTPRRLSRITALVLLATAGQFPVSGGFIQNPSFESNYNTTWPHYGSIDQWSGGSGVNDGTGPFHNTGTAIPDQAQVGFQQGNGTLSQAISGLTPGQQYWAQFFYDARIGSQSVAITVSYNGVDIGRVANVQPAINKNVPYYFASFPFTPDTDSASLAFAVTVTGDSTALFDAVTIVPRDTNNLVVINPSFEASGDVAGSGVLTTGVAGWQGTGNYGVNKTDGTGPYANNGVAPDQDHVAVLNDVSSLSQVINGLSPGQSYQLSFAYNATSGNTPHLQVKAGDTVLLDENVTAVGAANAYHSKTANFTATDFTAQIVFAQTKAGDQTVLLDDVKVLGQVAQPLPPLSVSPNIAEISPGQKVTVTVTVPSQLLIARAADLKFRSLSPQVASLTGADSNGYVTLHYAKNGANSQTLEMVGNARGSALLDVVDNAGLTVTDTLTVWVVTSFVKNPSFDSVDSPSGDGSGAILGWTGGSGVNAVGGTYYDNGLVPDRKQVAFIQGSKTLSQPITGLMSGQSYWLQFFYNARAGGGAGRLDLEVKFAGSSLAKISNIQPVGEGSPFSFTNVVFTPSTASGLLEFTTTAQGDATLLLDAITIVQRDPSDLVVINPSFEASGTIVPGVGYLQPAPMAGWAFSGGGFGVNVPGRDPFSDNGSNPDQDAVLFMQNAGSVTQTLTGLTPGKQYTVLFWVNPRNCCSSPPIQTVVRVSFNDVVIDEETIDPVGGSELYPAKQAVFTADATEGVLKIEHAPDAGLDRSMVLDNLRVLPAGQIPPIILVQPQGAATVVRGENVTLSVSAMGADPLTYQWQLNGANLPGQTNTTLNLTAVTPQQGGQYSVLVHNNVGTKPSVAVPVVVSEKVPGAFDSGVAADGSLVALGAVDPHYTLVDNPNNTNSTQAFVVSNPSGNWIANPATSQWIGPVADPQADPMPAPGFYKYRLKFDLTGFDPASVFVAGTTVADQGIDDIYLNDKVMSGFRMAGPATLNPFVITNGFQAGANTLDFRVYVTSEARPTGVLVSGLRIGAKPSVAPSSVALAVSRQGTQIHVSWPASATGFALQSSSLVTGAWSSEATAPVQQTDRWVVTVSPAGSAKFYRLIKQ